MPRILFADDEKSFAENVKNLLDRKGYSTDIALDGNEALSLLAKLPYDILVTDIRMPGSSGLELITECRKLKPAIQIIAISGGGYVPAGDYLRISKLFGADSVLQKPFFIEQLISEIERLLNKD